MNYTPDPNIVKQLREIDPDLGVRWDEMRQRWWVTCFGKDAILVRNDDDSYRPLDGRIVTRMRHDAWEYRQYYGVFHQLDREQVERNKRIQDAGAASERDNFSQYAKEEMYPRVFGVGGANGRSKFAGWSPN